MGVEFSYDFEVLKVVENQPVSFSGFTIFGLVFSCQPCSLPSFTTSFAISFTTVFTTGGLPPLTGNFVRGKEGVLGVTPSLAQIEPLAS